MHKNRRAAHHAREAVLLDHLRRTFAAADPIPPTLESSARELLSWRTVDADLAELLRAGVTQAPTKAE